jgi:pseudaminic acid cytidylyltransferase
MNIAVIPARGGSQRISRKNIRLFAGRPMLAWSIEAAQESQLFEQILVSTDDPEIASVARSLGAVVPFTRPKHLADHHTGLIPVISHAAEWVIANYPRLEGLCCMLATAPLLQIADLTGARQRLDEGNWEYCFSASPFPAPVQRSFQLLDSQLSGVRMLFPEHLNSRSQDLPACYHDAAQFYWGKPTAWLQQLPIFAEHSSVWLLPRWRVQDIDTEEDWRRAEILFQLVKAGVAAGSFNPAQFRKPVRD